jgi:hypothetical protein
MKNAVITNFISHVSKSFLRSEKDTVGYRYEKRALVNFIEEIGNYDLGLKEAERILNDRKLIDIKIEAAKMGYIDEKNEEIKQAQNEHLLYVRKNVSPWIVVPVAIATGVISGLVTQFASPLFKNQGEAFDKWLHPDKVYEREAPVIKMPLDYKLTPDPFDPMNKENIAPEPYEPFLRKRILLAQCNS